MSIRNFFVGRAIVFTILLVLLGLGYLFNYFQSEFLRQRNECISLIQESIENDRIKDIIKAPLFTSDGITQMRCNLTKGFTQFEVSGVDTEGEDFSIFQTSGGMAASGADSVYDYCYLKNNQQVSGIRITGRQSATSTPTCF